LSVSRAVLSAKAMMLMASARSLVVMPLSLRRLPSVLDDFPSQRECVRLEHLKARDRRA
jgi:hypothetical protein